MNVGLLLKTKIGTNKDEKTKRYFVGYFTMFARSPKTKHTRQKSFSVQQLAPRSFYEAVAICETDDVAIVRELLHSNNRNVAPYCVFYACFGAPHPVKTLNMLFNSGCNMETPIPKLPKEGPFSAEVRS